MIKNKKNRQIRIIAMGMALCVLASPMPASAAESSVLMASGGVASVLEMERSLEEYIQIAQDAQGASWGYTNIGSSQCRVRQSEYQSSALYRR